MDVDAVLLSVQERDKWRRRVDVLQRSLAEVRAQRTAIEARLKKIKRDLGRLASYSAAVVEQTTRTHRSSDYAPTEGQLIRR